jgi:hypothetical protein
MPGDAETGSRADRWVRNLLIKHGFLIAAVVAMTAVAIIVVIALTRPLSDTIVAALIGLVVTVAGGVINLAYIEPNKDRAAREEKEQEELEKKEEVKNELHLALYSEIVSVYCGLKRSVAELKSKNKDEKLPARFFKTLATFDLYHTLRLGNPMSFYQLDDAHAIDAFYSVTEGVLRVEPGDPERTAGEVTAEFERVLDALHYGIWSKVIGIKTDLLIECSRDSPLLKSCINELIELLNDPDIVTKAASYALGLKSG